MERVSDNTLGKVVSLATLSLGIAIGFIAGVVYRPHQDVQAQAVISPTPTFKDITPGLTTATFGANTILAHEIAADNIVVNGYDLMKMQENILNYLATRPLAERADIQNLINASKASTIYRIARPTPTPPSSIPNTEKK